MTFDQTADRVAVEGQMLDTCRITRDPEGVQDDVLDPVTLELVPPSGDASTVYEGPCSISPYVREENREEGDREETRQMWHGRVPKDGFAQGVVFYSGPPLYGDLLEVLTIHANGDASLVGRRFTLTSVRAHTLGVSRRLVLQDEKGETAR